MSTFRFNRNATALLLVIALLSLPGSLPGQQAPDQPPSMVIRATVRRVILDVGVSDSLGNPVSGLTRKDFSVAEDDKAQRILSFDAHDLESSAPLPKAPPLPANTFLSLPTEPERGPLYIMLLDLVNTEVEDQMTVRSRVSNFIQSRPPGTRFAIFVLSDELRLVQGFTSDQGLLSAALDTHHPKPHVPMVFLMGANSGRKDPTFTLEIFEHIARFVDGLPGRKNIIWISGAFPLRLFPTRDDGPLFTDKVKRTLDTMARDQVSIYPVDARGVVVTPVYAPGGSASGSITGGTSSGAGMGRVFSGSAAGGASSRPATASASVGASVLSADYQIEDEIARVTGGHAFYGGNDVAAELNKATERGAAYYELSYSPTNRKFDGRLRTIEVKLARKGYHLDYRRTYYGEEDSQAPIAFARIQSDDGQHGPRGSKAAAVRPVGDSLDVEMQYGAPMAHDLLFKAHVYAIDSPSLATPEQMLELADQPAYFRTRRKNRPAKPLPPVQLQTFAIEYTLPASHARPGQDGAPAPMLEVAAAAYDVDGRMLNGSVQNAFEPPAPIDVNTTQEGQSGSSAAGSQKFYRVQQQLDVPLAATTIRIAVRDLTTNRLGTVEIALPLAPEAGTS